MTYYNGYINWDTKEGATNLHGIYEFNTEPQKKSGKTTLEKSIKQINIENKTTLNIIFVFSCRLVEYQLPELFDVMPHINPTKYFNNISLTEHFTKDKLKKIFIMLKDEMNEIIMLHNPYNPFNIGVNNIIINITEKPSENFDIISKFNFTEENKNDLIYYISTIFNNYDLFELLYNYINQNIVSIKEWYKQFSKTYLPLPYRFNIYNNIILFLGLILIYPLVKIIDEVIEKNDEIIQEQRRLLTNLESEYYKYNIYEHIKKLLNIPSIKKNIEPTRISFNDNTKILELFNEFIKPKRLHDTAYYKTNLIDKIKNKLQLSEIKENRLYFSFWCYLMFNNFFNIKSYYDKDMLIELFFKYFNNDNLDLIDEKINIENIKPIVLQHTDKIYIFLQYIKHDSNSYTIYKTIVLLFLNVSNISLKRNFSDINDEYYTKYLKYKIKYLSLKN
jgi:hypothetical protein